MGGSGSGRMDPFSQIGDAWHNITHGDEKPPDAPSPDLQVAMIGQGKKNLANDFNSNKGALKTDMYDNLAQGERGNLARNMAGIKSNYNNRGLLYSGLRQNTEAGAEAQSESTMAHGRQSINNQIDEKSKQLDADAAGVGLSQAATQGAISDQIYSQALAEQQASNAAYAGIGGGLGQVAGGYISNLNRKQ